MAVKSNKNKLLVVAIIFTLLFILFLVLGFIDSLFFPNPNEENTTEFNVTFVEIAENRQDIFFFISAKEYSAKFSFGMVAIIDLEDLLALQNGDNITIRVENRYLNSMNSAESVTIVALKTSDVNIVTLKSHNNGWGDRETRGRVFFFVFGGIFLLIVSVCFLKVRKQ